MGVQVVAVYSRPTATRPTSPWPTRPSASARPPQPRVTSTSRRSSAPPNSPTSQAIHPGYGFLSENPGFAEKCRDCKIEFIGPPHEAMHKLGNKDQARRLAVKAGVPVVPGSDGLIQSEEQAVTFARAVGFPVLIKAAAGGGGRGMRVARDEPSLKSGLHSARREAESAFKDGSVYLERYIDRPRHVEVQLFGDRHGNVVHLWERDCSLQRRHQKLVEESPAPNLPDAVRRDMCAAAVRLARTAGYQNAGTCEFLVDQENRFYFIEVNARIQVEHPGHGVGHGHRSGEGADPRGGRRTAVVPPGGRDRTAAPRWSAASTPKTRPPTSGLRRAW